MADQPSRVQQPKTPELDKLADCADRSRAIGEFLDWLIDEWASKTRKNPANVRIFDIDRSRVLYQYFGIDSARCERERRELLVFARLKNAEREECEELGLELS